jgi:hypothetical protein
MRTFEDTEAVLSNVPLLFGIFGPSSSGKTFSALRLATGIQQVSGGEIFVVDTESCRAKHYADKFTFRHLDFRAPFGPLDYLAAVDHCVKRGARTVIIDSMSHEHEGPGGVLEQHDEECERLQKAWRGASREKVQFPAWGKPKAARRRLINSILQMPVNLILCFRAKEKVTLIGNKPTNVGWMPIGGDEYLYECTARALLLPGARGVPTWHPTDEGSKAVANLPDQFKAIFDGKRGPLDEQCGASMAQWAAGSRQDQSADTTLLDAITSARTVEALQLLVPQLKESGGDVASLRSAYSEQMKRIQDPDWRFDDE